MHKNSTKKLLTMQIALLAITFIISMYIVFIGHLPTSLTWSFWNSEGAVALDLHLAFSIATIIVSFVLPVLALKYNETHLIVPYVVAFSFILASRVAGIVFLLYSMAGIGFFIMAAGWLVSVLVYGYVLAIGMPRS